MSRKYRCSKSFILGSELYPRIARRQQRTAPFSDSWGGRPCFNFWAKNSGQKRMGLQGSTKEFNKSFKPLLSSRPLKLDLKLNFDAKTL